MNKTEAAYAAVLDGRIKEGVIQAYWFEHVTLKLSPTCRYIPDFMVVMADGGLRFVEIKGTTGKVGKEKPYYHNAGGKVKVLVAAEKFPFVFTIAFKARGGSGWREEEIGE